jgi:hypothetical protein
MKLELVTGRLCWVNCYDCGQQTAIGDGADQFQHSPGLARLSEESFTYLCPTCADSIKNRRTI